MKAPATTLMALQPGDSAIIDFISGDDAVATRLSHLGFLPGTLVRAVRRAPLGDPTIYELRGNQMCLRRAESDRIVVRAAGTA